MARLFDDAASQYLRHANALLSDEPMTFAGWFNMDTALVNHIVLSIHRDAGGWRWWALWLDTNRNVRAEAYDVGGSASAITTTAWALNTWHHACAVFAADDDRSAYLDGGGKGTDNVNKNVDVVAVTEIGRTQRGYYASGMLAEVALWNIALSDAEVLALARGMSPFRVRGDNLIGYWPIHGTYSPEPDYGGGGANMTLFNGPTVADHVPLGPPFGFDLETAGIWAVAAPPLVTIPVLMYDYRRRRID